MNVPNGRRDSELRELRQRISEGTYGIDPRAVADAILAGGWITAARTEQRTGAKPLDPSGDGGLRPLAA